MAQPAASLAGGLAATPHFEAAAIGGILCPMKDYCALADYERA